MRHTGKRIFTAGLALSLLLGQAVIQPARASEALGHDLHTVTQTISQGTTLTTGYFWSDTYSDLRTERYVTYTPGDTVVPTVAYGDTVLTRATLTDMARSLEEGDRRVVGGVNGDFYVLATGAPLGIVVTEGVLRSSSSYHWAVGFRSDGTAFVGKPYTTVTALLGGERVTVTGGVNKIRQIRGGGIGGLTLLTSDFGESTENTSPGVDVFLKIVTEDLGETVPAEDTGLGRELTLSDVTRIGGRIRCTVDFVTEAAGANPIPKGFMVLTMNGEDDPETLEKLRALERGDEVCIDITTEDERWEEAVEALGAMYRLLEEGEVPDGLNAEQTARTAVGIREDGSILFYTVDGKQPGYSVGCNCTQLALRLRELGCVDAVGLDGGGSTTLGVSAPEDAAMRVVNRPSGGVERANSTALFLTTALAPTGEPAYLRVTPGDALLLSGAGLPLSAAVVDTGFRTMGAAEDVTYTVDGTGSVEGNTFTAGETSGTATVIATQGELTGTATVTVVSTPDTITLTDGSGREVKSLPVSPNETVSLTASAAWRNLPLVSQNTSYTWTCDGEVGAVTPDGVFTAGEKTASGTLTVTAGERSLSIPVNVTGHVLLLDREDSGWAESAGLWSPDGETGPGVTPFLDDAPASVRLGWSSLGADYRFGESGTADLRLDLPLAAGERYLRVWVRGDGSSNALMAIFAVAGEEWMDTLCGLSFTDWKYVSIPIPEGAEALTGLRFVYGGAEDRRTGRVWLDHFTSANEDLNDALPPTVTLRVSGQTLTASLSDDVDKAFDSREVRVRYDGTVLAGTWNAAGTVLTVPLPEGTVGTHRLSVTAMDASGNLSRATYDLALEAPPPEEGEEAPGPVFADMTNHWATPYADYLYEQGVTRGVSDEGLLYFEPNANITRAEFFTMVARWMGLDLTAYEEAELPFADAGDIPAWARAPLAALYAKGVVSGSLDNGVLYAHPGAQISRAEVMTILGRTMGKGWLGADLSAFPDQDEVPAWAEEYVRVLVGQKVVSGYEDGRLAPASPMTRGEVAKVLYALR